VRDFSKSIEFYKALNYSIQGPVIDELQNAELMICLSDSSPPVELIKPINEHSPVKNILEKSNEQIYHVCYEVNDIRKVELLFKKNYNSICVKKPTPAILFNNRLVSFYYIKGIGLIELLQE